MSNWKDFFRDQRGNFNIFTCIALAAAVEMLAMIPLGRYKGWAVLSDKELYMLALLYLIAAVGYYLLGIYLNKMPATLNLDTGGGDATLAAGAGAVAESTTPAAASTILPASE